MAAMAVVAATSGVAVAAPLAPAEPISLEVVAGAVLTEPEAAATLGLPYPDGWTSSGLSAGRTRGVVDASVILGHRRSASHRETYFVGFYMWPTAAKAARAWAAKNSVSNQGKGSTLLSHTSSRFVWLRHSQPGERGVTVHVLLGSWSAFGTCYTRDSAITIGQLTRCAGQLARAQGTKAASMLKLA
jgi:hypothetical protein